MKKLLLLTALILSFNIMFSQTSTVDYYNWSDPTTYKLSPNPIIKGYGYYSDSLSDIFEGKTFFEHNSEYYCITSWADYYYWFTQEYSYAFEEPHLYEYYYWAKDDFGMASYIASNAYLGKTYPSSILIAFGKREVENNRLNSEIEIEKSQEEIDQLQKELDHASGEKIKKENTQTNTKPEIFQKDVFRNNKLKDNKYQKADDHKIEVKEPRKSSSSKKSEK